MTADPPPTWPTWLRDHLDRRGWRAADLTRASGGKFTSSYISRWLKGEMGASAEAAADIAELLGADPAEALRAAGFDRLASLVSARPWAGTVTERSEDPMLEWIESRPNLTRRQKRLLVQQWEAMMRVAEAVSEPEVQTGDMAPDARHVP